MSASPPMSPAAGAGQITMDDDYPAVGATTSTTATAVKATAATATGEPAMNGTQGSVVVPSE